MNVFIFAISSWILGLLFCSMQTYANVWMVGLERGSDSEKCPMVEDASKYSMQHTAHLGLLAAHVMQPMPTGVIPSNPTCLQLPVESLWIHGVGCSILHGCLAGCHN